MKELYASLEGETSPACLTLKTQEIPLGDPRSNYMFIPKPRKPFAATPAAIALHGKQILICLQKLQALAAIHGGLDYLQVFHMPGRESLWFIEDDEGGAITALLPSDY